VKLAELFQAPGNDAEGASLEEWKTYLRWQMLHGSANGLSEAFVKENFDFYAADAAGRAGAATTVAAVRAERDGNLGEALGKFT